MKCYKLYPSACFARPPILRHSCLVVLLSNVDRASHPCTMDPALILDLTTCAPGDGHQSLLSERHGLVEVCRVATRILGDSRDRIGISPRDGHDGVAVFLEVKNDHGAGGHTQGVRRKGKILDDHR